MKKIAILMFSVAMLAACQNAANTSVPNSNQTKPAANNAAPILPVEKTAQTKPGEAIKIMTDQILVKAGGAGEANIKLEVVAPYHVNSNPPSEKSLIPTEIVLQTGDGLTVGKPIYPKGISKTFAFSEKPVSVYEGAATTIKVPLSAAKNASGSKVLNGEVKFQPCDDEVCYPPQSITIMLPVTVE